MIRRIKAFFMALVMMFTTIISLNGNFVRALAADDGIKVVFHFTNENNDYDDYRMWLWTIGDGFEVMMNDEGTEATYELNEVSSTLRVGYIIKRGEGWEGKDWDNDRFVDLSNIISGRVDVYIESGVGQVITDTSNAIKGVKMMSAKTEDLMTIDVQLSGRIDNPDTYFKVRNMEDGLAALISKIDIIREDEYNSIFKYRINMAEQLDIMSLYEVVYGDENRCFMIGMPILYDTESFENQYTYTGDDLGTTYTKEKTTFRVWAPLATDVKVKLYESGTEGTDDLLGTYVMKKDVNGTWVTTISGDLNGVYYTYEATVKGKKKETIDPYAVTAGVNGKRGMIIDLDSTDPEGWEDDKNPCTSKEYTDDVIYELHVRDFSYEESSGVSQANRGKYLAFTETGTTNSFGDTTGIDYLKELGVTHVHLLPVFDYSWIDETKLDVDQFNWGYDPQNFNLPEGSYSSDPYNGAVRVKEFKQMVKAMHDAGISVVMDVVYGHVARMDDFSVNMLTPDYYSRPNSNGSGCGNDTATERIMNRKFIIDSMVYWAKEYHIDGFRIDQVGLFDVDTVNALTEALHEVDETILLYGEGWAMTTNVTKDVKLATQGNSDLTPGFGYFNDQIRDAVKGGVFDDTEAGYVTRNYRKIGTLLENLNGAPVWASLPNQVINYSSCHDNYTLFDKLALTNPNDTYEERVRQNNLASAILFTSQGVPFFQAGEELLRTKPLEEGGFEHNSYASPSSVNSLKWDDLNKPEVKKSIEYYKGLIELRKHHAAFRMTNYQDIYNNFTYLQDGMKDGVIVYQLNGGVNGEIADGIIVVLNPNKESKTIELPEGIWNICVNAKEAGTKVLGTAKDEVLVEPISAMVLLKGGHILNVNGSTKEQTILKDEYVIIETSVNASEGMLCKYVMEDVSTGKITVLKNYSNSTMYMTKISNVGAKKFKAYIKDAEGNITETNSVNVNVIEEQPLSVNLTVNRNSPNHTLLQGEYILLEPEVTGGFEGYTYKYVMEDAKTGKVKILKDYSTSGMCISPLTTLGTMKFYVYAKDSSGTVIKSNVVSIEVIKEEELAAVLKGNGSTGKITVNKGENITLKAEATGGSEEYTYKYAMLNVKTNLWTVLKNFGGDSQYVYQPQTEGTYQFALTVKDSEGNTVAAERITVDVIDKLSAKLLVNGQSENLTTNVGEKLSLKAEASGGSKGYTYKYAMLNVKTGEWTILKNFGSQAEYSYIPSKEGTYQFASTVKDSSGNTIATNRITLKVEEKPKELTAVLKGNGATENVTVKKGTKMTLGVEASGGSKGYTYKYAVLNVDTGKWSVLRNFGSSSEYVYELNYPGTKQFAVTVKDSSGKTIATNRITVVVK